MTFKATESSSAPIVLGREPIPKPAIPRGRTLVPRACFSSDLVIGDRITFDWTRGEFCLTYHSVLITRFTEYDIITEVTPQDLVSWETIEPDNRIN